MRPNLWVKGKSAIDRLFLLCCVLFLFALAHNHYQLITYPLPLDYLEPIMVGTTALIAEGGNPYSLEHQPARMAVYPPLNNIVVAPLTLVFGNTLPLHRAVNGVFILASCLLCFLITYKPSRSIEYSLAAALIFYAGLLYYSTPIAGPNGLGLFLFLSSVCIPWFFNFSNRSLAAGLIIGVMAFYTKQYFIASLGYIALYLFIAVSKKKAIIFGAFSTLVFLASLALVHYTSPYFIDDTITSQGITASMFASNKYLLEQLLEYGQIYLPVLGILGILGILGSMTFWNKYIYASRNKVAQPTGLSIEKPALFNLGNLSAPLLGRIPSYIWFCFTCSLAVIVFKLGKHPGNQLTYLFQLVSPFLLAGTFILGSKSAGPKWLYQLLIVCAFYTTYSILARDFSIDQKNWDRLRQVVSEGTTIYASPIVLSEIIESGAPVYYDGSTSYFQVAILGPSFLQKKDPENTVSQIWKKYTDKIHSMIEHQDFDVIVLEKWTQIPEHYLPGTVSADGRALLEKYYERTEVIKVWLAKRPGGGKYALDVWKRKAGTFPEIDSTGP